MQREGLGNREKEREVYTPATQVKFNNDFKFTLHLQVFVLFYVRCHKIGHFMI